jgi:hypothetical protein
MLRIFVLLLILGNGLCLAYYQGWLRAYGFAQTQQAEPQRSAQQVKPEAVHVLTPAQFERVQALVRSDLEPKVCWQAGPFEAAQLLGIERALGSALEAGDWRLEAVVVPERWIVYMGKFANQEALLKKRGELVAMQLTPQGVNNPDLELGLSLGSFESQAKATEELARLGQRGIRTAKVLQESPERSAMQLKLPSLPESKKSRLNDLKPALGGKSLKVCGT